MDASFFLNNWMPFQTSVQNNAIETHTYFKTKNYRGKATKTFGSENLPQKKKLLDL